MKNTLFAIALATAAFAAAPSSSRAAETDGAGGFFVNGNVGQSNLSRGLYDDKDTAYGVNLGYRWALNPIVALGVEGGYSNLGKFDAKDAYTGLGRASLKGWTAGVNGHINITPQWYASAHAGLFQADAKGWGTPAKPYYVDDSSTEWYSGVGLGYDLNRNLSVGLNYDYYKISNKGLNLDPGVVSASAEYRF